MPRLHVLQFVILLCLLVLGQCIELLTFIDVNGASRNTVGYITNEKSELLFDATATQPRVVYFAEKTSLVTASFNFACHVNRQNSPLKLVSICCRSSSTVTQSDCYSVSLNRKEGDITCLNTRFTYIVDPFSGVLFSITIDGSVQAVRAVSGLFHCSVTDSSGTSIQSNEIDVRDAAYYLSQINNQPTSEITRVPPIDPGNFPYLFQCLDVDPSTNSWPNWLNLLSSSYWPYKWAYCEVSESPNAKICTDRSSPLSESQYIEFLNGTMFLLNKMPIETKQIAIVCKSKLKQQPLRTFAGDFSSGLTATITAPLSLLPTSSSLSTKLEALTATEKSFTMRGGSSTSDFKLRALYREPPSGSHAKWTKDGEALPKRFATMYTYQLPDTATIDMDGTYVLTVTSKEDPTDILRFVFHVNVVEPPTFISPSCLSGLIYVMEGADYNVSCPVKFQSVPKSVVGVNLYEADSPEKLRELLMSSIDLNPKLKTLQFNFEMKTEDANTGEMHMLLHSLQEGQNFQLSAKLESPVGDSYLSTSIRVVPTPKLVKAPSGSNCFENCDTDPYNVTCLVDPERIKLWKEQFNMTYTLAWIIQGQWSSLRLDPQGIGRFAEATSDGTTLTIWPRGNPLMERQTDKPDSAMEPNASQQSDKKTDESATTFPYHATLKEYITDELGDSRAKDLVLQCWIRLYVHSPEVRFDPPPSDRVLRRVSRQQQGPDDLLQYTPRLFYDSRWEPNKALADQLAVTRAFTPDPKPASANLAWIAAVIIGVIIVVAVIGLSVWLYTRDRGETYQLYDKERAHGNDPIREMKEKEAFQTYQRQEEQPIASSRYSLNDGSVNIETDDEGELAQYGKDYDEQGSFIHGYTSDPIASALNPLPNVIAHGKNRLPQNNTAV